MIQVGIQIFTPIALDSLLKIVSKAKIPQRSHSFNETQVSEHPYSRPTTTTHWRMRQGDDEETLIVPPFRLKAHRRTASRRQRHHGTIVDTWNRNPWNWVESAPYPEKYTSSPAPVASSAHIPWAFTEIVKFMKGSLLATTVTCPMTSSPPNFILPAFSISLPHSCCRSPAYENPTRLIPDQFLLKCYLFGHIVNEAMGRIISRNKVPVVKKCSILSTDGGRKDQILSDIMSNLCNHDNIAATPGKKKQTPGLNAYPVSLYFPADLQLCWVALENWLVKRFRSEKVLMTTHQAEFMLFQNESPKFRKFERVMRSDSSNKIYKVLHQPLIFSWNKDIFGGFPLLYLLSWRHVTSLYFTQKLYSLQTGIVRCPTTPASLKQTAKTPQQPTKATRPHINIYTWQKSDINPPDFRLEQWKFKNHRIFQKSILQLPVLKSPQQIFSPRIQIICVVCVLSTQNQRRE